VDITARFLLGNKSVFNNAESSHESELRILEHSKLSQTPEDSLNCRPEVNPNKDNYLIGYGSLMNKDSRQITDPNATYAAPILVS
ncbi:gamma-glutamylcyclotransferase, partial [Francisella tularensis subsp. holarctica]|nr:gamma-glutamylcyclotransferase [Francisella tularensis subsp. holarctica]